MSEYVLDNVTEVDYMRTAISDSLERRLVHQRLHTHPGVYQLIIVTCQVISLSVGHRLEDDLDIILVDNCICSILTNHITSYQVTKSLSLYTSYHC